MDRRFQAWVFASRRHLWVALGLVAGLFPPEGPARAAAADLPTLTTSEQVRKLSRAESERGYPVQVRGVITFFDSDWSAVFVQDETGGIYTTANTGTQPLQTGQLVELEGQSAAGAYTRVVRAPVLRVLGTAPLPAPHTATFDTLARGSEDSRWVETTGVIRSVTNRTGWISAEAAAGSGRFKINFPRSLNATQPTNWVDARVKLQAVCAAVLNERRELAGFQLFCPRLDLVEIVEPAPDNAFAGAASSIQNLRAIPGEDWTGHRARALGTVTFQRPGRSICITDPTGSLWVETTYAATLAVGDVVEVAGFPGDEDHAFKFEDAVVRRISRGPAPAARVVPMGRLVASAADGELVETEAYLLDQRRDAGEAVFVLGSQNVTFQARLADAESGAEAWRIEKGSLLRLTGVCSVQPASKDRRPAGFELLLRSPADVVVRRQPPWWVRHSGLAMVALAGISAGAVAGWVIALRRSVTRQTRIIRRQLEREAAFANLGNALSAATTPPEAARVIAGIAQDLLGWDSFFLDWYDALSHRVRPILSLDQVAGQSVDIPPATPDQPPSPMALRAMAEGGQLILRRSADEAVPDLIPAGNTARKSASLLFVVVRKGTEAIGFLSIQSYRFEAYDREALNLLQSLADHCAGALGRLRVEEELRLTNERLRALVKASPLAIMTLDTAGKVTSWNAAAERLLGWSEGEVLGRLTPLVPEEGAGGYQAEISRLLAGRGETEFERQRTRKDGAWVDVRISTALLRDGQGQVSGILALAEDVTERKRAREALLTSLNEKEVMLKEIHHRVKNNLQVVSGLLQLQSDTVPDPKVKELFLESQDRIKSMALIHEALYQSKNLAKIDFDAYLKKVAGHLFRSFGPRAANVTWMVNAHGIVLDINRAVPCGLIVNELVSNSLKYAFPANREGELRIELRPENERQYALLVSDNGVGLPRDWQIDKAKSFGWKLVRILATQIGGTVELYREAGLEVKIAFNKNRPGF